MSRAECVMNMQLAAYDVHAWTMFGTLFALFASINKQRLCGCACLVSNNTMLERCIVLVTNAYSQPILVTFVTLANLHRWFICIRIGFHAIEWNRHGMNGCRPGSNRSTRSTWYAPCAHNYGGFHTWFSLAYGVVSDGLVCIAYAYVICSLLQVTMCVLDR